jgi:aerobic carbon-monoxide dehydrogenase small subunit
MRVRLEVNGRRRAVETPPMRRLLDLLRDDLRLTGAKEGCGEGECGACAVLVEGRLVNSCLVPACQADGKKVTTIEGLESARGELHPMQQAFWERGGAQCGICTPGMIVAAVAFAESGAAPETEAIREALAGNLCRCTGYQKIVESVAVGTRAMRNAQRRPKHRTQKRSAR